MARTKKQKPHTKFHMIRERLGRVSAPRGRLVHYGLILMAVSTLAAVWIASRAVVHDMRVMPDQQVLSVADPSREALEHEITDMVEGYPIERMTRYIALQDKTVAAYLVSIAKKESDWGRRVPIGDDGRDCYNYWGYRGVSEEMGTGGHTCFDSPREAVQTVAARIHSLVYDYGRDKPADMIVWKCGYTCEGHDPDRVTKWEDDVAYYFYQFIPEH